MSLKKNFCRALVALIAITPALSFSSGWKSEAKNVNAIITDEPELREKCDKEVIDKIQKFIYETEKARRQVDVDSREMTYSQIDSEAFIILSYYLYENEMVSLLDKIVQKRNASERQRDISMISYAASPVWFRTSLLTVEKIHADIERFFGKKITEETEKAEEAKKFAEFRRYFISSHEKKVKKCKRAKLKFAREIQEGYEFYR